jgi:hypothetical protein
MHDNAACLAGETVAAVLEYIGSLQAEIITVAEVGLYLLYRNCGVQQL